MEPQESQSELRSLPCADIGCRRYKPHYYKAKVELFSYQGHCDLGSSCKFAHSPQDLAQSNTDRTKTQLCSKFSSTGFCQVINTLILISILITDNFSMETVVILPMESQNFGPLTPPACSQATLRLRCAKHFCQEGHVLVGLNVTMLMALGSSETCSSQRRA